MTQYDQEFENWWDSRNAMEIGKKLAFDAWQAAKASPQPEVKPLELEGGEWYINIENEVKQYHSTVGCKNAGRERKTRELAEAVAEKMRKRDRLHAFVTEHCGYEYEWKPEEENCFIYHDVPNKRWYVSYERRIQSIERIYMPRKTAEYLCAALNDGRLVL